MAALLSAAPGSQSAADQFQHQVAASCSGGVTKEVSAEGLAPETKRFELACAITDGQTGKLNLAEELAAATEYLYSSPHIAEYFNTHQQGDCTFAERTSEFSSKTPLVSQTIQRDPASGNVLYWEAHIVKDNWFVDMDEHIWVFFRPDGSFRESYLSIQTSGSLTSKGIHSEIHLKSERP
jgi:hypothetical protein